MKRYELFVQTVEPSGTELADKVTTVLHCKGNEHEVRLAYKAFKSLTAFYRLRIVEITIEESHKTIEFTRSTHDNPFVTQS